MQRGRWLRGSVYCCFFGQRVIRFYGRNKMLVTVQLCYSPFRWTRSPFRCWQALRKTLKGVVASGGELIISQVMVNEPEKAGSLREEGLRTRYKLVKYRGDCTSSESLSYVASAQQCLTPDQVAQLVAHFLSLSITTGNTR